MPSKRLPSDHELQDLIEVVENSTQKVEETYDELPNDVAGFLSFFNITHGANVIRANLLFHIYRQWSHKPVEKNKFFVEINKYLVHDATTEQRYYLLNEKALTLSKKSYQYFKSHLEDKTKSPLYKTHFENFLNKYELKPGSYWMENYLLYYLYDRWTYDIRKQRPLGLNQFYAFCKLYFKHRRRISNRIEWFAVDESVRKFLPEEIIEQIKEGRKAHNKKGKPPKPS